MKANPLLLLLAVFPGLGACSFKLSHADGSVTYFGAVNLREGSAGGAPFIHSKRLGVMMDVGTENNGVALGYDDRLVIVPENNAITEINYRPREAALEYNKTNF